MTHPHVAAYTQKVDTFMSKYPTVTQYGESVRTMHPFTFGSCRQTEFALRGSERMEGWKRASERAWKADDEGLGGLPIG